jgi:hypothetical protein
VNKSTATVVPHGGALYGNLLLEKGGAVYPISGCSTNSPKIRPVCSALASAAYCSWNHLYPSRFVLRTTRVVADRTPRRPIYSPTFQGRSRSLQAWRCVDILRRRFLNTDLAPLHIFRSPSPNIARFKFLGHQ